MSLADSTRARGVRRWSPGLLLATAAIFGPGLWAWIGLNWRQAALDRRLAKLSEERERLTQEQRRLETDPSYMEGLIRTTFKWAQKDELVIPLDGSDGPQDR